MQIELVVFDMAGTTVYDGDAVHRCLGGALKPHGVDASRDEINGVMGIAKPIAIERLMVDHGMQPSKSDVDIVFHEFLQLMASYYSTSPDVREMDGASDVFRWLKAKDIKIVLDTGFSRDIADIVLNRLGWQSKGLIDATITSDEVLRGRPYPDMIIKAMQLTGVKDASKVAKVGDTPSDLEQGTVAGCGLVVGVTNGSHTRSELAQYDHTHLIESVADLPNLLDEAAPAEQKKLVSI